MSKADSRSGPKPLARLRKLILEAVPGITEEWKSRALPLKDPKRLFNAGLDAKTTRAIDFNEGDEIDVSALKELVRGAVALNGSASTKK